MNCVKFISAILFLSLALVSANVYGQTGNPLDVYDTSPNDGKHTWANNIDANGAAHYNSGGTIQFYLDHSCTITNKMFIENNTTVIFDLNGHTLTAGAGNFNLFQVQSGSTLIICDNSTNKSGAISGISKIDTSTGKPGAYHRAAGIHVYGGTFKLQSGTIKNFRQSIVHDDAYGGAGCAVYIDQGGRFEMSGGAITDCGFNTDQYYSEYKGVTYLHSRVNQMGGAVFIHRWPKTGTEQYGTFIFSGGTISNCTAYRGGAVYIDAPDAPAPEYGVNYGGVEPSGFEDISEEYGMHMSGSARIENCIGVYKGGAVYVNATNKGRAYFKMSGGTISGCKSTSTGCGVHVKGRFIMEGGTIENNVPFRDYVTDFAQSEMMASNTPMGGGICSEGRYEDGVKKYTENGEEKEVQVGVPFYHPAVVKISGNTTVISGNIASSGGGVMAYYHSEFDLSDATLSGNYAIGNGGTGNGGAIYVLSSIFNFNSGTLRGNFARRYGGGININDETGSASLTLNGDCNIIENIAGHGGGISQEDGNCTMTINSNQVEITGNKARGIAYDGTYMNGNGNGGGLFIEKGTLNIVNGLISGNFADGSGGGISLRSKRVSGDINFNMTGGYIQNNNSVINPGTTGGGIDIYADPRVKNSEDNYIPANVKVNIYNGNISGNYAGMGGGLNIYVNSAEPYKNTATVTFGNESGTPGIFSNQATSNGGAMALENGTVNIDNGSVYNNKAANGGAFYVKCGDVNIKKGEVKENEATQMGGGLYVFNIPGASAATNISFAGGDLLFNTAQKGGGICVDGKIALTTSGTNVKHNSAVNGGGIYLLNNATMSFEGGIISNNKANGNGTTINTAYNNEEYNNGVGGGVYLAPDTELDFSMGDKKSFGLYGNRADNAADDIFSCGNNTKITLPYVKGMNLQDYDVPTSDLYWVEDYVTKDQKYTMGTKVKVDMVDGSDGIRRYQDALKLNSASDIFIIPQNAGESKSLESYSCLALGYELYYVTLIKNGLQPGDASIFNVYYYLDGVGWQTKPYRRLCFSRPKNATGAGNVTLSVVLTSGVWKFVEENWSLDWKYTQGTTSFKNAIFNEELQGYEMKKEYGRNYTFTFENIPTSSKLPSAEDIIINSIPVLK